MLCINKFYIGKLGVTILNVADTIIEMIPIQIYMHFY